MDDAALLGRTRACMGTVGLNEDQQLVVMKVIEKDGKWNGDIGILRI